MSDNGEIAREDDWGSEDHRSWFARGTETNAHGGINIMVGHNGEPDHCGPCMAFHDSMAQEPARRLEAPELSAERGAIERLHERIKEARSAISSARHHKPTSDVPEPSALDAVKEWVSSRGGWTAAAEPAYIKGYEDAQEIVRGLIQAHTEPQ